jgi:hypothetical protein
VEFIGVNMDEELVMDCTKCKHYVQSIYFCSLKEDFKLYEFFDFCENFEIEDVVAGDSDGI